MQPATRVEVITTLLVIGALVGFVGLRQLQRKFADHPSNDDCRALLDRYVEHVVHAIDPKPTSSELSTRKLQARALAAEDPSFARCPTHLTRQEAECAMRAFTADEFERCLP